MIKKLMRKFQNHNTPGPWVGLRLEWLRGIVAPQARKKNGFTTMLSGILLFVNNIAGMVNAY